MVHKPTSPFFFWDTLFILQFIFSYVNYIPVWRGCEIREIWASPAALLLYSRAAQSSDVSWHYSIQPGLLLVDNAVTSFFLEQFCWNWSSLVFTRKISSTPRPLPHNCQGFQNLDADLQGLSPFHPSFTGFSPFMKNPDFFPRRSRGDLPCSIPWRSRFISIFVCI